MSALRDEFLPKNKMSDSEVTPTAGEIGRKRLEQLSDKERSKVLSYLIGWYDSPCTKDEVREDFWSAVIGALEAQRKGEAGR